MLSDVDKFWLVRFRGLIRRSVRRKPARVRRSQPLTRKLRYEQLGQRVMLTTTYYLDPQFTDPNWSGAVWLANDNGSDTTWPAAQTGNSAVIQGNATNSITVDENVTAASISFKTAYTLHFFKGTSYTVKGGTMTCQSQLAVDVPPSTTGTINSTIVGSGQTVQQVAGCWSWRA